MGSLSVSSVYDCNGAANFSNIFRTCVLYAITRGNCVQSPSFLEGSWRQNSVLIQQHRDYAKEHGAPPHLVTQRRFKSLIKRRGVRCLSNVSVATSVHQHAHVLFFVSFSWTIPTSQASLSTHASAWKTTFQNKQALHDWDAAAAYQMRLLEIRNSDWSFHFSPQGERAAEEHVWCHQRCKENCGGWIKNGQAGPHHRWQCKSLMNLHPKGFPVDYTFVRETIAYN